VIQGDYEDKELKIEWTNQYEPNLCLMLINFAVSHSMQEHPGFLQYRTKINNADVSKSYFDYLNCSEFGPFVKETTTKVTIALLEKLK